MKLQILNLISFHQPHNAMALSAMAILAFGPTSALAQMPSQQIGKFSAFDTIKKERISQVKQHLDCLEKAQSLRELRACRPKNQ